MHVFMCVCVHICILIVIYVYTVMARQSERYSLEEKQKKGRGAKRKQDWNSDEPLVNKRGIFDTPSPLSMSRPNSVTSSLLNDSNNIDVVNDDSDSNSTGLQIVTDQNTSGRNTPDALIKAPPPKILGANSKSKMAGGKVARPKKKGGSAAAAAGAMAGKLAASQAAFAAYGVPYNHLLSSNLAVPSPVTSSNPPSNHSSPRASPVPPYSTANHTP